jgi:hypothetical protein
MKIRWFFFFFGSFAPHFQIKLSTHGSNLNSIFVIMSELEFFLLTGVLTQNFNTMVLVKLLEKNKKLHIKVVTVTLKVTSPFFWLMVVHEPKKKVKKCKKPRFYGQNNLLF